MLSKERKEFAAAQNELLKRRFEYWLTVASTAGTEKERIEALSCANNFLHAMQEYVDFLGDQLSEEGM